MEQSKEDEAMTQFTEETKVRFGNEFSMYQHRAKATSVYPVDHGFKYLVLGVAGECGELANKVKKILRGDYDGKGEAAYNKAVDDIMEECGDIMWYNSQLALLMNVDYGTVAQAETFDDLLARCRKELGESNHTSIDNFAMSLCYRAGGLCDLAIFYPEPPDETEYFLNGILRTVCHLSLKLERPFSDIFHNNLAKLQKRHHSNTLKGDNRG